MSLAKYNEQKKAEAAAKLATEKEEPKLEVQNTSTSVPITETGTPEEKAAKMAANLSASAGVIEEAKLSDWVSPYDVNYKELETILDGEELSDYVGSRLPEEEVKRIETDYKLYLKNK